MMNGAVAVRSHLMQQFIASARNQSRPPLALLSLCGGDEGNTTADCGRGNDGVRGTRRRRGSRVRHHQGSTQFPRSLSSTSPLSSPARPPAVAAATGAAVTSSPAPGGIPGALGRASSSIASTSPWIDEEDATEEASEYDAQEELDLDRREGDDPSPLAAAFQHLILTRRTTSNFLPTSRAPLPPPLSSPSTSSFEEGADAVTTSESSAIDDQRHRFVRRAVERAVRCAASAPNHRVAEPTTYYRIPGLPSPAAERLLDVSYETVLRKLRRNSLSGDEACKNEAARKREKWSSVAAFVAVTTGGMEDQCPTPPSRDVVDGGEFENPPPSIGTYDELPVVPPVTMRQLEGYASSCASVQNLLLSLHSEGLSAKWVTGPVVRTRAFRELIDCGSDEMVVGLVMVGWSKRHGKMPKRRQELERDVLRDVAIDSYDGAGS